MMNLMGKQSRNRHLEVLYEVGVLGVQLQMQEMAILGKSINAKLGNHFIRRIGHNINSICMEQARYIMLH